VPGTQLEAHDAFAYPEVGCEGGIPPVLLPSVYLWSFVLAFSAEDSHFSFPNFGGSELFIYFK